MQTTTITVTPAAHYPSSALSMETLCEALARLDPFITTDKRIQREYGVDTDSE